MPNPIRLLVVGAAPGSLGEAIAQEARDGEWLFAVNTAGITPHATLDSVRDVHEDYFLNVEHVGSVKEVLHDVRPHALVCTVGVNAPAALGTMHLGLHMMDAFRVNVVGVLEMLALFAQMPLDDDYGKRFVAVSSNSARIARRASLPYCASKAALSMAVRCAGRELAGTGTMVWGYEPGLLAGTPMTRDTEAHFGPGDPAMTLHRMRGVGAAGLVVDGLARQIVNDVALGGAGLNGVLVPYDAGEQ